LKIRITHPAYGYQAGLIYDVPELQAQELLKADYAISIPDDVELVDVTNYSDPAPAFVEGKKKVKNGNR
jgi:hypothetical protein